MTAREIGRVRALWRYPVKSMAAEPLDAVDVSWEGFAGDRRWAFVQPDMPRSGFPWLTIRERPEMWHYVPSFDDPARPEESRVTVRTTAGRQLDVIDADLADELGAGTRVIKQNRGVFDTMPLSLITTRTIASLGSRVGTELVPLRFRPNLLVEPVSDEPFPEDAWVGSVLRIGGLAMRVDQRDARCVMITVDPQTTERTPAILRTVAQELDGCLGVYGSVVEPGRVALGDAVVLEG